MTSPPLGIEYSNRNHFSIKPFSTTRFHQAESPDVLRSNTVQLFTSDDNISVETAFSPPKVRTVSLYAAS